MQDDQSSVQEPHRGPHHPSVKLKSLKILMDYSALTGRKWTAIRNEIISVTRAKASLKAPLVVRQDLENWASGSVLTDDKFRWIYAFLTHPLTLLRPEFRAAKFLIDPISEKIMEGKVLEKYVDSNLRLRNGRRLDFSKYISGVSNFHQTKSSICGIFEFIGNEDSKSLYLAVSEIEGQDFLVAHLMAGPKIDNVSYTDWDMHIISGFAIVGPMVSFYIFDEEGFFQQKGTAHNFIICPKKTCKYNKYLYGVFNDALYYAVHDFYEANEYYLPDAFGYYLKSRNLRFTIRHVENKELKKIVDDLLWRGQHGA